MVAASLALLALLVGAAGATCPFMSKNGGLRGGVDPLRRLASLPSGHPSVPFLASPPTNATLRYADALALLDLQAVRDDITALLTDSQPAWPADYGNYGPFFIRLAWHCAGSYRLSDGRGGCDGGRQRFDPERSWPDNTNLDKARSLLMPIKEKFGRGLSWGDLIIMAGDVAIESMGGPTVGFCAGRIDDPTGRDSLTLGPTAEQQILYPCEVDGQCEAPLGATQVGLIYVDAEGPMGQPLPDGSVPEIRDTFGRMGMDDRETVALIGGGHAFGKTHGACPDGAGLPPNEDPRNPWPGLCGTGRLADAWTSGFEGPWVPTPTQWSNSYFNILLNNEWEVHTGPGGNFQWRVPGGGGPSAPNPDPGQAPTRQNVMMLTTDVALLRDPAYLALVQEFSTNQTAFDAAFGAAWYKLTARDMGPHSRCIGDDVPPPQPWQFPLPPPPPPADLPDFAQVREDVVRALTTDNPDFPADRYDGEPYYGALFVRLAWQCASSYRSTDYLGGCNGARIRYAPESDWPTNAALDGALLVLNGVKERYGAALSWADLIAFAGTVALEEAGGNSMAFCPGRTDAAVPDGGSDDLEPRIVGAASEEVVTLMDVVSVMGLSLQEFVALMGGHTLGQMHADRTGFTGQWSDDPTNFSNQYYQRILNEEWEEFTEPTTGTLQYRTVGRANGDLYALSTDLWLRWEPEMAAIAMDYASDEAKWKAAFSDAWVKMMNVDLFDGPGATLCSGGNTSTKVGSLH